MGMYLKYPSEMWMSQSNPTTTVYILDCALLKKSSDQKGQFFKSMNHI